MLGPTTIETGNRYGFAYAIRKGYTTPFGEQRKPLPHDYFEVKLLHTDWATTDLPNLTHIHYMNTEWGRGDGSKMVDVSNKARERFYNRVHGDVQGLVNLAEYRQTWSTLHALLGALRRPTQSLEEAFLKYKKASKSKSHDELLKTTLRDSADGWLAWHFGVEPLIKDVISTVDLLVSGVPGPQKVFGSSKATQNYKSEVKPCSSSNASWGHDETYQLRCKLRAQIEITNPNLWLANSFGLVNLPAVAWELVPWSFAFDWVFNVGALISSLSDEFGIELTNATTTYSCHTRSESIYREYTVPCNWHPYPGSPIERNISSTGFRWKRELSIVSVGLRTFKTAPWSLTRIATALALVMQQLPRSR